MKTKLVRLLLGLLFGVPLTSVLRAEEGGSGHYLPGSMASFIDSVPLNETFIVRLNLVSYSGSFSGQPLPFARFAAFDVNADSFASGLTLLWRPPIDLGKKWSFALSTTVPYIWLDVSAQVAAKPPALGGTIGPIIKRSDSINGVGDIVLMPLMLNYNFSRDFNTNFRFAI